MRRMDELTNADYTRIAAAATCDPRTARRCLTGKAVRPSLRQRILRAALALGYPLPTLGIATDKQIWC